MNLGIVSGTYVMTQDWEVVLPGLFQKSFDDEDLVLSRPNLEVRVGIWGNDQGATADERLRWFVEDLGDAEAVIPGERDGDLLRAAWRVEGEEGPVVEGFVLSPDGHVHLTGAADDAEAEETLLAMVRGVRRHRAH